MSQTLLQPLPDPPSGFRFYRDPEEIERAPEVLAYQHLLLRAWEELDLSAVLTLNGIPTVYIRDDDRPLEPTKIADLHCQFWNQGLATVLLLREPGHFRVLSSMVKPISPEIATDDEINARTVESLDLATQAAWAEKFYLQLGTGHYYSRAENVAKFNPRESVDAYLIDNLEAVRDALVSGADALEPVVAHAFLGRILFTCYLCHRGIISLGNYLGKNAVNGHPGITSGIAHRKKPTHFSTINSSLNSGSGSTVVCSTMTSPPRRKPSNPPISKSSVISSKDRKLRKASAASVSGHTASISSRWKRSVPSTRNSLSERTANPNGNSEPTTLRACLRK